LRLSICFRCAAAVKKANSNRVRVTALFIVRALSSANVLIWFELIELSC